MATTKHDLVDLKFFSMTPNKSDPGDDWESEEHVTRLPRAAAIELARFFVGFAGEGKEQVAFAVHESFLDTLTAEERAYVECETAVYEHGEDEFGDGARDLEQPDFDPANWWKYV